MATINKFFKHTFLGITGIVSSLLFISKYKNKPKRLQIPPFFSKPAPYFFAHIGGNHHVPGNTKLAFHHANKHKVDGFDIILRITKDHHFIVFNDIDLDASTNGSGKVSEHTLAELQTLDAGYHYVDINGNKPFVGHPDAKLQTLEELLQAFPDKRFIIHIKDNENDPEGLPVPELLLDIIKKYQAEYRVLVTSEHVKQLERFKVISEGHIALGASQGEILEAFVKYRFGASNLFEARSHAFQMPIEIQGIKITSPKFIYWLIERNIVPGFIHINNLGLIDDLIVLGVHTIITDRPDLVDRYKQSNY